MNQRIIQYFKMKILVFLSYGIDCRMVAETYNVSREDQDAYAVQSHQRAAEAQQSGKFEDEIIPIEVNKVTYDQNGPVISKEVFKDDEID